jgi:hypothetical protein
MRERPVGGRDCSGKYARIIHLLPTLVQCCREIAPNHIAISILLCRLLKHSHSQSGLPRQKKRYATCVKRFAFRSVV